MQSLENVAAIFKARGVDMPPNLLGWSDNTVRENKNSTMLGLLGSLTAFNKFRTASMLHHRVGHTHGPLDQVFGIISTAMRYVDVMSDPTDALEKLGPAVR